jgi:hypothetical protein
MRFSSSTDKGSTLETPIPINDDTRILHSYIRRVAVEWLGPGHTDIDSLCAHMLRSMLSFSVLKPMKRADLQRENAI